MDRIGTMRNNPAVDRAGDAVMYTYNHRTLPCICVSGIRVRVEERPLGAVSSVYAPASMFTSVHWQWTKLVILDSCAYVALVADYREESPVVPRRHLILNLEDYHELSDWSLSIHAGCMDPSVKHADTLIELITDDEDTILVPNMLRAGLN